jgi:hypothetical protein
VGQEPQEFSVRLPFPFYCGWGGLANFGQAWIRMRGLHLEILSQDAPAAGIDGRVTPTNRRRDKSDISRAQARVAELADAPDLGSGAERRGGSSPPSRIIPQLTPGSLVSVAYNSQSPGARYLYLRRTILIRSGRAWRRGLQTCVLQLPLAFFWPVNYKTEAPR